MVKTKAEELGRKSGTIDETYIIHLTQNYAKSQIQETNNILRQSNIVKH